MIRKANASLISDAWARQQRCSWFNQWDRYDLKSGNWSRNRTCSDVGSSIWYNCSHSWRTSQ
jgi:hypothetical protein